MSAEANVTVEIYNEIENITVEVDNLVDEVTVEVEEIDETVTVEVFDCLPQTPESDPIFQAWLDSNPLNDLLTETAANLLYYPLSTNPAGYVVGQEVEEYTDFASFPLSGNSGIIYIALDSGLFYSWDGLNYISSSPPASLTKLQQSYNASPNGKILLSLANGPLDLQPAHASINYTLLSRNLAGVIQAGIFPNGTMFGTVMDASTHQGGTGVVFQENFGVVKMIANRTGVLSTNRWDVFSKMEYAADYSNYFTDRSLVDKGYSDKIDFVQTHNPFVLYRASATTIHSINISTGVAMSGFTARTLNNTNSYTRKNRLGNLTTAVAGTVAHYRNTTVHFIPDSLDYFEQTFGTAEGFTTAGMRAVFGIFNNAGALSGNIEYNTLVDLVGIVRLSTSNNWHIIHNNNAGTATTIDLGASFPANVTEEQFTYKIHNITPTSCDITFIRRSTGLSVTHSLTTDLPDLSVLFTVKGSINNNTNAVILGFDFFGITEKWK